MDSTELCYLSALELRSLYEKREVSPVEVTKAVLARIDQLNGTLNAFVTVTSDLALQQARAAEEAYGSDETPPLLAGIPGSLKDLTATKGILTTRGSLLYKDWVPDYDAPIAERIAAAGMVLLGKTNTPELGWKGDSGNRVVGPTHNPWKHGQTSGGSSGGAGAAVASGLGPLAQGSDGAGSIRIPASFCGIYGFKPSFGRIPQYPASAVELLSHAGPMTRTVRDAALMLNALAGADPHDRLSFSEDIDFLQVMEGDIHGLRVGWSPDLGYAPVTKEVRDTAAAAAARFEELGCKVDEVDPGIPDPWDEICDPIWASAFSGYYHRQLEEIRDQLTPGLLEVIESGLEMSAAQLAEAHIRRNEYYHRWRAFMEDYDLLLTPTLPVTAFTAGDDQPGEINGQPTTYLGWTKFTYPFNITGQPAATVPCGFDGSGLPIGLQIVGRYRDDTTVLRASAAFEEIAPWLGDRPKVE